jgi:D-glycero-D-manno-heptose 1,7-bisphosphate phosphatase
MKRAVFLDRDGVITQLVYYPSHGEWEGPRSVADLQIADGVADALRRLREAGWLLFVITNQPSYAKGKIGRESLEAVHAAALEGLPIEKSYVCFHHPEAVVEELRVRCECRKPGAKSIRDAAGEFGVDLSASWMVGDQDSDVGAGRAAGCRVALIENPHSAHKRGKAEPDVRFGSLAEFVEHVVDSGPQ